MSVMRHLLACAIAIAATLQPAPTQAAEGRVPLNAALAAEVGYPLVLSGTASYVLTSNLAQPDANTDVISITADDVTLDLNGFAILGSADCDPDPNSCTGTGTGDGVVATGANAAVVNGVIRGVGGRGIALAAEARVENVAIYSVGDNAISVGDHSIVRNNRIEFGGSNGIYGQSSEASLIVGNLVDSVDSHGITFTYGCLVAANVIVTTAGKGIDVLAGGHVLLRNNVSRSASFGIHTSTGVVQGGNVLVENTSVDSAYGIYADDGEVVIGNATHSNTSDGILANSESVVLRNNTLDNTGWGIQALGSCAIGENAATGNTAGNISGGTAVACNAQASTKSCPPCTACP